jgi:hypothetical protein
MMTDMALVGGTADPTFRTIARIAACARDRHQVQMKVRVSGIGSMKSCRQVKIVVDDCRTRRGGSTSPTPARLPDRAHKDSKTTEGAPEKGCKARQKANNGA